MLVRGLEGLGLVRGSLKGLGLRRVQFLPAVAVVVLVECWGIHLRCKALRVHRSFGKPVNRQ